MEREIGRTFRAQWYNANFLLILRNFVKDAGRSMEKWRFFSWWLFLLVFLPGCAQDGSSLQGFTTRPGIEFRPFHFERSLPDCATDTLHCVRVKVALPHAAGAADSVADRINDTLTSYLHHALAIFDRRVPELPELTAFAAEQLFSEYRAINDQQAGYALPWWVDVQGRVRWQNEHIASIELVHNAYFGGAHPNETTTFFNFDLRTGRVLDWTDVVVDAQLLQRKVEAKFRSVREVPSDALLQDAGFFWESPFRLPENFALDPEGLLLYYNTYEAGAFALGPTYFSLSFDELEGAVSLAKLK